MLSISLLPISQELLNIYLTFGSTTIFGLLGWSLNIILHVSRALLIGETNTRLIGMCFIYSWALRHCFSPFSVRPQSAYLGSNFNCLYSELFLQYFYPICSLSLTSASRLNADSACLIKRSEERRVGKECRL